MKKTLYSIRFSNIENNLSTEIFIKKKQFVENIKLLDNQLNADEDYPVRMIVNKKQELDKIYVTTFIYSMACADVILKIYKCKKNYQFK